MAAETTPVSPDCLVSTSIVQHPRGTVARIADELEPARHGLWETFDRDPALAIYEVLDELHGA